MGAFLMPEAERRGAREKRIPGVPKGLQMRLGGMLRRHMLLMELNDEADTVESMA